MNPLAQFRPELKEKIQGWILSFHRLDPRYKILTFFNLVRNEGADNIATEKDEDYYSYDLDRNVSQYHLHRGAAHAEAARRTSSTASVSSFTTSAGISYEGRVGGADNDYYSILNNPFLYLKSAAHLKPATAQLLANMFDRSSILTVWRPCSRDAMRKMMEGTGVGKGLDIKGKSAQRGTLSALVPFLQIHVNEHKAQLQSIPAKNADMRVYYKSNVQRDHVVQVLHDTFRETHHPQDRQHKREHDTVSSSSEATPTMADDDSDDSIPTTTTTTTSKVTFTLEDDTSCTQQSSSIPPPNDVPNKEATCDSKSSNSDFDIQRLDTYQDKGWYGLQVSQRLFWNATIADRDIRREGTGTETGRPSTPGFQDANLQTLRVACSSNACSSTTVPTPSNRPMPVVVQTLCTIDEDDNDDNNDGENGTTLSKASTSLIKEQALDPLHLVMAYEEGGTVTPVVSDFDGFLMGWKREALWFGCNLPRDQEDLMLWCVDQIENILEEQNESPEAVDTWTMRWLNVLKREAHNGFQPEIPEYGFGDPKSYGIMEQAAKRLRNTGAVRHGSECFNYYFPQEIDDKYLLISDTLRPVPWRYVSVTELQSILSEKIAEGFVFPLNPKWILCDDGWFKLFQELMASNALYADLSKDVWYPPSTGVRDRIYDIHKRHPRGFQFPEEGPYRQSGKFAQNTHSTGYSPLRQNLDTGEKLTGDAAVDLAELELDDYRRRSVKLVLARQIKGAHLENVDELCKDTEDFVHGHAVLRDSENDAAADSVCSSKSGSTGKIRPSRVPMRTLFRTPRQVQKGEEPRDRSENDMKEMEEDPEYAAAKAAVNSVSTDGDEDLITSSTGSLRLIDDSRLAERIESTRSKKYSS